MGTIIWCLISVLCFPKMRGVHTKYIEGTLHTSENWAFLARFCFLSEHGEFEYHIEFSEEQGEPNLLLYYDAANQWPAIYKTNKNCQQKESVLRIEQNQIINLTSKIEFRDLSGCSIQKVQTTERPRFTVSVPTLKPKRKQALSTTPIDLTTEADYNTISANGSQQEGGTNATEGPGAYPVAPTTPARKRKRQISQSGKACCDKPKLLVTCHNARRFRSSRERWWFVAISNCNNTRGINIHYKILMTNGPPGDYWHQHFSADEFHILPVLMAFTIAYTLLMLAIVVCTVELKSRHLLHSTYKLFVLSVIVQFAGILMQSLAYLKYAVNGIGLPSLKIFGSMMMGCSETCYLLLLLLLAKGYTVTRGRLPITASIKLTIFMCLYAVTYISLFIYQTKVFDPGQVLYMYESPAGYGLIILRIAAWLMFIYSTIFTLKHYPEKSNFYYPFNICGTIWFVAGPAFILSANNYIDKWVRESVVCAVLLIITFGGHLTFLILTMPSVANKNFPYHVRTTQIGVMEVFGATGSGNIERFGHHVYEPTSDTVIVPLSKRTEEIFAGLYTQRLHSNVHKNHLPIDNNETTGTADICMQNVLNWSLAKNVSILDRTNRNSFSSQDSRHTTEGTANLTPDSKPTSAQTQKEVPVELFSISKTLSNNQ